MGVSTRAVLWYGVALDDADLRRLGDAEGGLHVDLANQRFADGVLVGIERDTGEAMPGDASFRLSLRQAALAGSMACVFRIGDIDAPGSALAIGAKQSKIEAGFEPRRATTHGFEALVVFADWDRAIRDFCRKVGFEPKTIGWHLSMVRI